MVGLFPAPRTRFLAQHHDEAVPCRWIRDLGVVYADSRSVAFIWVMGSGLTNHRPCVTQYMICCGG